VPFATSLKTEEELLSRARVLAGQSIAAIAQRLGRQVPPNLRRAKGWAGELIERALGAAAGSKAGPDFPQLGIEVKTVPVARDGRPCESTHVCAASLADVVGIHWENSPVRRKLVRVLWVPVEAEAGVPLGQRRIGQAMLWSPTPEQEQQLRLDWEELMELIALGRADEIRGEQGVYLQLRPKAASGRARTKAPNAAGELTATLPRGFYLRPAFTAQILAGHYAIAR